MLPWMLSNWFGVSNETSAVHLLPLNVKIAFYLGAGAFFGAVLWTVCTAREYPPADIEAFRRQQRERSGLTHLLHEIPGALREMPRTMKWLAVVQFFTWLGLFCMWIHFSNAVPVVFGAAGKDDPLFKMGGEWAGVCYAAKDAVTFVAAFVLMAVARIYDRRRLHGVCLLCGALGLFGIGFVHGYDSRHLLVLALSLGGIAWASILSMPYSILAGSLPPHRMGVYMGIFNFFIVIPEILAALTFGPLVKHLLGGNLVHAVMLGGAFMLIAAIITQFVPHSAGDTGEAVDVIPAADQPILSMNPPEELR
jgi:maltose/moltooligosaccharide transporter